MDMVLLKMGSSCQFSAVIKHGHVTAGHFKCHVAKGAQTLEFQIKVISPLFLDGCNFEQLLHVRSEVMTVIVEP